MPYILLKRSDLPAGLLQTLGILPNESQRNLTLKPVGQTGYRNAAPNAAPSFASTVFTAEGTGLTAWLLANVSDASGTKATAAITTVTVANIADGDFFTLNDGQQSVVFGLKKTAAYAVPATRVTVDVTGLVSANDVRDAIITAVNGSDLDITASSGGAATVTLTNDNQNQTLARQNNSDNSENVANVGFAVTDFSGAGAGTASASLTRAEAIDDASDILALVTAGSALTQASINTMTTGNVTKAQVAEVLDILAGRNYVVPSGSDVEVGGAFVPGLGAFDDTVAPLRRIYDTESLRISFAEGQLSLAASSSFTYGGTTGAAVVVYNDDGSLYTG